MTLTITFTVYKEEEIIGTNPWFAATLRHARPSVVYPKHKPTNILVPVPHRSSTKPRPTIETNANK